MMFVGIGWTKMIIIIVHKVNEFQRPSSKQVAGWTAIPTRT